MEQNTKHKSRTKKLEYGIESIQNSKFKIPYSFQQGFTILELLIVVAVVAVISVAGVGSYRNFGKTVELSSTAKVIAADLRQMQAKAMIGEGGVKWGVRFESVNDGTSRYMLFSTPNTYDNGVVTATITLPKGITFSTPSNAGGVGITINWTNSASTDFSNVVILRRVTYSVADILVDGSLPSVNDIIGVSTVVYTGSESTFNDSGISSGTTYYYKIFSKDIYGNYDTNAVALGPFMP